MFSGGRAVAEITSVIRDVTFFVPHFADHESQYNLSNEPT